MVFKLRKMKPLNYNTRQCSEILVLFWNYNEYINYICINFGGFKMTEKT